MTYLCECGNPSIRQDQGATKNRRCVRCRAMENALKSGELPHRKYHDNLKRIPEKDRTNHNPYGPSPARWPQIRLLDLEPRTARIIKEIRDRYPI